MVSDSGCCHKSVDYGLIIAEFLSHQLKLTSKGWNDFSCGVKCVVGVVYKVNNSAGPIQCR